MQFGSLNRPSPKGKKTLFPVIIALYSIKSTWLYRPFLLNLTTANYGVVCGGFLVAKLCVLQVALFHIYAEITKVYKSH